MNKAIFLDLDGTLLTSKNTISKKTISSIKNVIKNGYEVFLITGKSFVNCKKIYEKLNLKTELITYGGQMLSKKIDGKYIHQKIFLNIGSIKEILNEPIVKNDLQHFLIENEKMFFTSDKRNDFLIDLLKSPGQKVKNFTNYKNESILGFYFDITKREEKENLKKTNLLRRKYPNLFFSYWDTEEDFTIINVSPIESSKWNIIKRMKEKYRFEKVITFGNGYTDVEMIRKADVGYAMKNSFEPIKKWANIVTEFDNNDDGVAFELDKLIE